MPSAADSSGGAPWARPTSGSLSSGRRPGRPRDPQEPAPALREARRAGGGRGRAVRRHEGHGVPALQGQAARADGRRAPGVRRAAGRHARHDEGRGDEDGPARLLHRHRLPARGIPRAVPGQAGGAAHHRPADAVGEGPQGARAGVRRARTRSCSSGSSPRPSRPRRSARCTAARCTTGARSRSRSSTRASTPRSGPTSRTPGMILRLTKALAPGLDAKAAAEELRERVLEELDYEHEAQNQRTLRARLPGPSVHPRAGRGDSALDAAGCSSPNTSRAVGFEDVKQLAPRSATASRRSCSASTSARSTSSTTSTPTRTPATTC